MMSVIKKIVAVVVLILPIQAAVAEDLKKIETIGTSRIYNDNFAKAREDAIADGLAVAVNLTALGQIPSERFVEKFEEIHPILYGNTNKFIRNYKILSEFKSDNVYRVLVRVTVSENSVKESLTSVGESKAPVGKLPKLLFFMLEKNPADDSPVYWWSQNPTGENISETILEKALKEKGFEVVQRVLPPGYDMSALDNPLIETEDAIRIGAELKADIVIIGKSAAEKSMNTMDTIKTFKGTVTARAYLTDTGEEIAASSQNHVNVHQDEIEGSKTVLSEASALTAEDLSTRIVEGWKMAGKKAKQFQLFVGGTSYLGNFVLFRRGLMSMPGVQKIQLKEMKSDEAAIDVDYKGTSREMADALMLKTFDTFGINLYEVTENHLRIELIPK